MFLYRTLTTVYIAVRLLSSIEALDLPNCLNTTLSSTSVCNQSLDPAKRAASLVASMSIEEKLVNLVDHSLGAQRLGLPAYDWWSEALHGVAYSPGVHFAPSGNFSSATSFPNPITISAAFDDLLVEKIGASVGAEARAFANAGHAGLDFWTPNINPYRDPRWGRGLETPGEDPGRIANYVKSLLKGMEWAGQEPEDVDNRRQIIATCKHYAAYDLERWNGNVRYSFDAKVSMQELVEYYLPPFKQCARDSNVGSIMCSYNSINGTPACANEYLMGTVLREHWGWTKSNNYITSDCNAVHNIYADHKWVVTAAQAVGKALTAGTDTVCEAGGWTTDVVGAYNQSLLSEKVIDKALQRLYEGLVRADYFSTPGNDTTGFRSYGWETVNTQQSQDLARQAATDGIVLLKNDGTLPLNLEARRNQTFAFIGMWANDTNGKMLGNYNGKPPYYHTPLYAAQQKGLNVIHADGPISSTIGNYSAAIGAAKRSDVILYFGGIDTSIESEDRDRTSITWPQVQLSLVQDLALLGKPLIVVQLGTQVDNTPLLANPNISSLIWAGYPGMSGGDAVLDIITGAKSPSGRLPITQYPSNYTDLLPMTDMSLRPSSSSPGRTYMWYENAVLEFGYGLHYTNFSLKFGEPFGQSTGSNVTTTRKNPPVFQIDDILSSCSETHKEHCEFTRIPVTITNIGAVTSDFVLLSFISTKQGPTPRPRKVLAAYKRVRDIEPGEESQRRAELEFKVADLARVDGSGNTVLYSGSYCLELDVGQGIPKACFEVLGQDTVLDIWPQPKKNGTTRT